MELDNCGRTTKKPPIVASIVHGLLTEDVRLGYLGQLQRRVEAPVPVVANGLAGDRQREPAATAGRDRNRPAGRRRRRRDQ